MALFRALSFMEVNLIKDAVQRAGDISADVVLILESLKRISDYSSDIAEVVLNLSVEQILQSHIA